MSLAAEIESLVPIHDTVAMGALVHADGRRFEIPFNQRPWVWKAQHLEDLWDDVLDTVDKYFEERANGALKQRPQPIGNPHYFGAFLFYKREEDLYEVVDGQQRLTSLCMLTAILRELAQDVRNQSDDDLTLRNQADGLITALTAWLQSDPVGQVPRLKLDLQVDELFRQYVIEPRSSDDRAQAYGDLPEVVKERRGANNLRLGFELLRKLVLDDFDGLGLKQQLEQLRAIAGVIGEAFIATEVVVSDEPFALSIFGTLNARGVSLNAADQIKNELFEQAVPDEYPKIKEDWDAIVGSVPGGAIELFLRQRHLAFVNTECPKNELYHRVKERELQGGAPSSVTARWRKDAELLSFLTVKRSHPKIKGEVKRHLETLHSQLKLTYSWPLLLSAGHRFLSRDPKNFGKLARLTLAFCFRVRTIGQVPIANFERSIAKAAFDLSNGKDPSKVAKGLREENSNEEFIEAFADASPTLAAVQFYALYELEVHRAKSSGLSLEPFPRSPQQHIEHILPKRLSMSAGRIAEWTYWRDPEDKPTELHHEYVNRLGNLLILESEINGQLSNFDFTAKRTGAYPGAAGTLKGKRRASYADSKLWLVRDVLDESAYPGWTVQEIDERQEAMAEDAAKAWTLNYV